MPSSNRNIAELARNIAAVLKNPATPAVLYNAIADALNDLACEGDNYNPKSVERILIGRTVKPDQEGKR